MATPPSVNINNLSGKYLMNKTLSDGQDNVLSLQGIGWLTRKAVNLATVTLTVKHYEKDSEVHIDITSVASGLSSSEEQRVLNWQERGHQDKLFGSVKGKSRLCKKSAYERAIPGSENELKFLLAEVDKTGKPTAFLEEDLLQTLAFGQEKGNAWEVEQVWGFEEVEGVRRHTRRVVCKKGGKTETIRLVYDYQGPLDA